MTATTVCFTGGTTLAHPKATSQETPVSIIDNTILVSVLQSRSIRFRHLITGEEHVYTVFPDLTYKISMIHTVGIRDETGFCRYAVSFLVLCVQPSKVVAFLLVLHDLTDFPRVRSRAFSDRREKVIPLPASDLLSLDPMFRLLHEGDDFISYATQASCAVFQGQLWVLLLDVHIRFLQLVSFDLNTLSPTGYRVLSLFDSHPEASICLFTPVVSPPGLLISISTGLLYFVDLTRDYTHYYVSYVKAPYLMISSSKISFSYNGCPFRVQHAGRDALVFLGFHAERYPRLSVVVAQLAEVLERLIGPALLPTAMHGLSAIYTETYSLPSLTRLNPILRIWFRKPATLVVDSVFLEGIIEDCWQSRYITHTPGIYDYGCRRISCQHDVYVFEQNVASPLRPVYGYPSRLTLGDTLWHLAYESVPLQA